MLKFLHTRAVFYVNRGFYTTKAGCRTMGKYSNKKCQTAHWISKRKKHNTSLFTEICSIFAAQVK